MCKRLVIVLFIVFSFSSCKKESLFHVDYKIVAHRGYWKEANGAENSLEALLKANKLGVDGVELDICKTIDDSLVVAHGERHGEYTIAQTDFATLRKIRLANGELIPTLTEYLRYYRKIGCELELIVEIKHHGKEKQILEILEEFELLSQIKIISFSWDICRKIHQLSPMIHISYLTGDKSPQVIKEGDLSGIAYRISVYKNNPDWLNEARSLGLTTYVWEVGTESDFIWSSKNNLDYIVTDSPHEAMLFKYNYE